MQDLRVRRFYLMNQYKLKFKQQRQFENCLGY
jgi:hypothetical protein